ncbi:MAG: MoxR family ATPase [Methanobacteriota archaeon]
MQEIKEIQEKFGIIGREKELEKALSVVKAGRHLLIEGPVGVGKTVIALAISNYLHKQVYRVDGDERYTEQKLTGWFDPPIVLKLGYVKEAFIAGPLTLAMQNGGALFINELNRMPEAVQNVLLPSMDEFKIEIPKIDRITAENGFVIIATQNPREFIATSPISEALRDRFELVTLGYQSEEEEIQIVKLRTGVADDELAKAVVLIVRATREHPDIRRGASIRASVSICMLTFQLGGDVEAIRKACHLALPTRVELKEDAKKPLLDVIDEIVDSVIKKTPSNSFEIKAPSQDSELKKKT